MDNVKAPGWYEDPEGISNKFRYWDGAQWTQMVKADESRTVSLTLEDLLKIAQEIGVVSLMLGPSLLGIAFTVVPWVVISIIVFAFSGGVIAGTTISGFLIWSVEAAVKFFLVFKGLIKPAWKFFKHINAKHSVLTGLAELKDYSVTVFAKKFYKKKIKAEIIGTLSSAIVGFAIYYSSTPNLTVSILAISAMIISDIFINALFFVPSMYQLEKQDPEMFEAMMQIIERTG